MKIEGRFWPKEKDFLGLWTLMTRYCLPLRRESHFGETSDMGHGYDELKLFAFLRLDLTPRVVGPCIPEIMVHGAYHWCIVIMVRLMPTMMDFTNCVFLLEATTDIGFLSSPTTRHRLEPISYANKSSFFLHLVKAFWNFKYIIWFVITLSSYRSPSTNALEPISYAIESPFLKS